MSARVSRSTAFAARPRDPDAWVRTPEPAASPACNKAEVFTARLTVDVAPALRGRIKVAAFTRGLTVADMLRTMLEQAFPEPDGGRPVNAVTPRGLTRVTILFLPERVNDRVRFGAPAAERIIDRRCRVDLFEPGAVCGYVQWRANRYGTEHWRLWVLQAARFGERPETTPGIAPAAHIWLSVGGVAKVTRALALIDAIEAQALDPASLPESYWRTVHNRIAAGLEPRVYASTEHAERRARGGLLP